MDISTKVDFEVIDPKEGTTSLTTLVGRPWGRSMKETISLEKYRIKLKGDGKIMTIPLSPIVGKPQDELTMKMLDNYTKKYKEMKTL